MNPDEVSRFMEKLGWTKKPLLLPMDKDVCWCCGSNIRMTRSDDSVQCGSCFEILIER